MTMTLKILVSLLSFLPSIVLAQAAAWYQIELLVFVHNSNRALQAEFWPQEPGSPLRDNTLALVDFNTFQSMGGDSRNMLLKLNSNQLDLHDIERSLSQGGDYIPLFHAGWRQLVQPRNLSKSIYIRGQQTLAPVMAASPPGAAFPAPGPVMDNQLIPALEGTVTISLGKFLHADLDLLYTMRNPDYQPGTVPAATPAENTAGPGAAEVVVSAPGETTEAAADPVSLPPPYLKFRLQQHRRMRSKQLNYIDHPKLGAFIQILPYQAGTTDTVRENPPAGGGEEVNPLR